MKKILVPTDFEKPSVWAIEVATSIAKKVNGEIVLIHVIEQPTKESYNVEGQIDTGDVWEDRIFTLKMIDRSKKRLNELAQSIRDAGVKVVQELRLGNPFHGIREMITDHKADLIVMGTSGRSRFEEFLVGSNTEKVVRFSNCPVLTIHEKWTPEKSVKSIVYATSLVESEKEFSEVVRKTQDIFGARIHLVRINTPMNFQPDHTVKKVMDEFARKNKLSNYELHVFNDFSDEEGIIHFANMINADLIAMATHGRTGIARIMAGSITEDVVNHSARPVLTKVTR